MRQLYCMIVVGLTLIGAGLALLAADPAGAVQLWNEMTIGQRYALGVTTLGVLTGVAIQLSLWFDAVRLVRSLRKRADGTPRVQDLRRLRRWRGMLTPVAEAMNALVDVVVQQANRTELELKERDIQLKVAAAERDHAQAIIYSISDAVLVTDPFDELVLANESAARTFDFELEAVGARCPWIRYCCDDVRMIGLIREMRQSNSRTGRRIIEHQVRTPLGERVFKVTLSSSVADSKNEVVLRDGDNRCRIGATHNDAGVVAVLHDMTREKEVAEMKNDFVSQREPRTADAAGEHQGVCRNADRRGGGRRPQARGEFYEVIQQRVKPAVVG